MDHLWTCRGKEADYQPKRGKSQSSSVTRAWREDNGGPPSHLGLRKRWNNMHPLLSQLFSGGHICICCLLGKQPNSRYKARLKGNRDADQSGLLCSAADTPTVN